MITYRLSHPQLSHPLEVDSPVERAYSALIAWAQVYILRNFGAMLDREWTVEEVVPTI